MKSFACIALCLAAVFLMGADKPKTDLELIQGEWRGSWTSLLHGHAEETGGIRFTFSRNELSMRHGEEEPSRVTFKLDEGETPHHIDVAYPDTTVKGIYKLTNDTLMICLGSVTERPTEFKVEKKNDTR